MGLGTAQSYSVLGGQTVTNTGPTTLSGDVGVSPGTAITGLSEITVGGAVHEGDAHAAQAQEDLVAAYDDAAGLAPTASVSGDLVGETLTAGVYNSTGPLELNGTLTLDGQGDPNSVFIFQVASTLITGSASNVLLTNGAQACNVFWQVGSSATLGTGSTFTGTIMALTSISVTTGTTVEGRALARNGQVSLDTNVFTPPGCETDDDADAEADADGSPDGEADADGSPDAEADADGTDADTDAEADADGTDADAAADGTDADAAADGTDADAAADGTDADAAADGTDADAAADGTDTGTDAGTTNADSDADGDDGSGQSELPETGPGAGAGALLGLGALLLLGGLVLIRRSRLQ
ncbi:ice-binding family protein [Georgenia halophila]|uniref:ice-binding family protein n=1 Tax=Georgenia halophila TaxID=620889 RepID=UPI0031E9E23B